MEFNPDKYIEETLSLFSGKSLSLDVIKQFIIFENRHQLHKNAEYKDKYEQLFTVIRDNIIIPNIQKTALVPFFEDISNLYRLSCADLPPSDRIKHLLTAIESSFGSNDQNSRFWLLRAVFLLRTFQNQSYREDFLTRLSYIQSFMCFKSQAELNGFAAFMRYHYPDAHELMSMLLKNVFNDSFSHRSLTEKKAGVMWVVEIIWNMVHKEHPAHMILMDSWLDIFYKAMKDGDDELAFYMNFPIGHIFLNNCSEQDCMKVFNEKLEIPFSDYVQANSARWGLSPVTETRHEGKKRLAFVFDRIIGSSPVKLLISLLNYMRTCDEYELYVYDMAYIEKSESVKEYIDEITAAGAKYISNHSLINDAHLLHYYSHFNKNMRLRERITADGIDVLVVTNGRSQANFLLSSRSAPLQVYWDHGNHEYDTHGIDRRISHFDDGYDSGHEVHRFVTIMLDKYLNPDPETYRAKADEIRKQLPPHKVVLGSIGRIMKLSDEYLETVADILKQHPDAVYLACGTGPIDEKRQKVKELGIADRFIFAGWVDSHIYGHVIDIYLNTFPLSGGESVAEFMAKGLDKVLIQHPKG